MARQKLEQYYTPSDLAFELTKEVVSRVGTDRLFIEPSAGTGAFVDALVACGVPPENIKSYDLDPKREDIIQKDFLRLTDSLEEYVAIGNPPFGKGCCLAIKFVKKLMALGCSEVNFIVPRAMEIKHYALNSLRKFHCVRSVDIPEDIHFLLNEGEYDSDVNVVRCSFQQWKKREEGEEGSVFSEAPTPDWADVTPSSRKFLDEEGRQRELCIDLDESDDLVVFKSHGRKVGEVLPYEKNKYKANVVRILKVVSPDTIENLKILDISKYTEVSTIKFNPSISPSEMLECYVKQFNKKEGK